MFFYDLQGKALIIRNLDLAVSVRRNAADILALFRRCLSAPDKPAVGRGKFAPRHEESELEVFLVELVLRIERLERRDDLRAAVLERLGDKSLIHGITTGKTLDFHDEHTVPLTGSDFRKEPLHLRTSGYRFTGYYFFVCGAYRDSHTPGELQQGSLVPGKGFALAVRFCFKVGAGFSQVNAISAHIYRSSLILNFNGMTYSNFRRVTQIKRYFFTTKLNLQISTISDKKTRKFREVILKNAVYVILRRTLYSMTVIFISVHKKLKTFIAAI